MTKRQYTHVLFMILLFALLCQIDILAQGRVTKKEAIDGLNHYGDDSLFCLDKESRKHVLSLIAHILPNEKKSKSARRWSPWYVWDIASTEDHGLFVLVEMPTILTTPGQAVARINFFDEGGKRLAAPLVLLGWRTHPRDARLIRDSSLGYPLIEISSDGRINGRQYFVLKGTDVFLVRLETAEGEIVRNRYDFPNYTIGRVLPSRTSDAWKEVLASTDRAEVLQALVWLGGVHVDAKDATVAETFQVAVESDEDAKLVSAVRARPDVHKIIEGLTKSENRWIREAAVLALKPATDDE